MTYMPNARWYATDETRAHKNVASYTTVETDHAGNMRTVQWKAEGYISHCLQAFSEHIDSLLAGKTAHEVSSFRRFNIVYESIKGDRALSYEEEGEEAHAAGEGINAPTYRLTRSNIDYNTKNQVTAYHEVRYSRPPTDSQAIAPLEQWVKTTTDAALDYQARPHQFGQDVGQDPSLLTATHLETLIENPDGSTRKENSLTAYAYDKLWRLESAAGTTDFTDTSVWYYTTVDGRNRDVVKTRVNGADAYYYYADPADTASAMVFVDASEVKQGSNVSVGTAQTSYDILYGHPMVRQAHSTTFTYRPDRGPGALDPDTGSPYEPFMAQESTIDYTYGLRNNFLRMLGTTETNITFDPSDRTLSNTETVATTYEYNARGNLENVFGTGFGGGYKFDEAQQLWLKRNTYTVSVSYNQDELDTLGRALIDKKEILEIPE
jgi:hypothetical protein